MSRKPHILRDIGRCGAKGSAPDTGRVYRLTGGLTLDGQGAIDRDGQANPFRAIISFHNKIDPWQSSYERFKSSQILARFLLHCDTTRPSCQYTTKERSCLMNAMELKNYIAYYRRHPQNFIEDCCGIRLKAWQKVALYILSQIPSKKRFVKMKGAVL